VSFVVEVKKVARCNCLILPKPIMEVHNIHVGDYVEVEIVKVIVNRVYQDASSKEEATA
jgi:bifunctional DNA-binding transcriptional regulator/antitoxin component of YhaV-PrlF toxin-antitoxin module